MNKSIFAMIFLLASSAGMSQSKKIKNLVKEFEQQELVIDSLLNSYEKNDWEGTVNLFEKYFSKNTSYINPSVLIATAESYKNLASGLSNTNELVKRSEKVYQRGVVMHGDYLMNNGYKVDIYDIVDQPAEPEVGRSELSKYLIGNYIYPVRALESGIEGLVAVQIIVTPKGELKNFKVIKSVDSECDKELIRLLKESSPWKPAVHRNYAVHVREIVTLNFNIKQYKKRNK